MNKDSQKMGFTWDKAEVAALDRHRWHWSVAQRVQLDVGWTKVQGPRLDTCWLFGNRCCLLQRLLSFSAKAAAVAEKSTSIQPKVVLWWI